jgi:molybdopterin molybdotransferase
MPSTAELFTVLPPDEAWAVFARNWQPTPRAESIPTQNGLGRVLAADIFSPEDLPSFARSVVDGYAVIASDTYGASPGLPALLRLAGEAPMGREVTQTIQPGEAILTHTGSMIAPGADAVVMVEHTSPLGDQIEVMKPAAEGENVLNIGEDVRRGQRLYQRGHVLRPQDIGGLMALGLDVVSVAAKPRVGIISTGDEVVPPSARPAIGQVRDVNTYALAAMVSEAGGEAITYGIVPDQRNLLEAAAAKAKAECDLVVLSAGSSVSARDMSVEVINGLGRPGVLAHGVSVKPGKPSSLAVCDGVPVFGLPGNPVSAMVIARLFVLRAVRAFLGMEPRPAQAQAGIIRARLARNLASSTGREDYVAVRLEQREGEWWAVPVLGKSNLIYTLVNADGTVKIPLNSNGVRQGELVEVVL